MDGHKLVVLAVVLLLSIRLNSQESNVSIKYGHYVNKQRGVSFAYPLKWFKIGKGNDGVIDMTLLDSVASPRVSAAQPETIMFYTFPKTIFELDSLDAFINLDDVSRNYYSGANQIHLIVKTFGVNKQKAKYLYKKVLQICRRKNLCSLRRFIYSGFSQT